METPWLFIALGDAGVVLGIVLVALGMRFRRKFLWISGAALSILGAATVLLCPVCAECGGKTTQGSPWEGVCCVQSWRSAKNILWWELITEPGKWK